MAGRQSLHRNLSEISALPTAHSVGLKKVLLSTAETESAVTQIAVTEFRAGESVEAHIHTTMDEHYIFLEGEGSVSVGSQTLSCHTGDYLLVPAGESHCLKALTDMKFVTIGIAYDK